MSNKALLDHDYSFVLVSAMKDECPYILDWISYHLAIGFTHFVIMTNDCSDGTDKLCRQLEKLGILTHGNNKAPHPKGIQKTAYSRMQRFEAVQNAKWMMALDVDEYLRIDIGDGHVADVIAALEDKAYAISFIWQMFGNNDIEGLADEPVITQFTHASEEYQAQPYQIRGLKTLYRADCFEKIGTHRPIGPIPEKIKSRHWVDANGQIIDYMNQKNYWCAWNNGFAFGTMLGRVNHYAIRSKEAFLLKLMRGFVNRANYGVRGEENPLAYWDVFEWSVEENLKIQKHLPNAQKIKSQLLEEEKINRLHHKAVAMHEENIAKLRHNPELQEFVNIIMEAKAKREYSAKTLENQDDNNPIRFPVRFPAPNKGKKQLQSLLSKAVIDDYVSSNAISKE